MTDRFRHQKYILLYMQYVLFTLILICMSHPSFISFNNHTQWYFHTSTRKMPFYNQFLLFYNQSQ